MGSRVPASLEGRGIIGGIVPGLRELGTNVLGLPGITGDGTSSGRGRGPGRWVLGRGGVGVLDSGVLGRSCSSECGTGATGGARLGAIEISD